jgi:hypothetical protein
LPHLKKKPLQNSVEAVPPTSQKESNPKFCGGIVVLPNLKKNPLQNSVELVPNLKKNSPQNFVEVVLLNLQNNPPKILWYNNTTIKPGGTVGYPADEFGQILFENVN